MIWLLESREPVSEAELSPLLPLLDQARRERIPSFRQERNRVESALAGLLLRHAWQRECGGELPALTADVSGKPRFLEENAPQFNLSHCSLCREGDRSLGAAVACAISRFPVGVDVQGLHRYSPKFRRILSEAERLWVEETDSEARFTALWTRKEAYGKALGVGIGYDMQETDFSGDWSEPRICRAIPQAGYPARSEGALLWTVPKNGYCVSVCAEERLELRAVTLDELQQMKENK